MSRSLLLIVALLVNGLSAVAAWGQTPPPAAEDGSEIWWLLPDVNPPDEDF